MSAARSGVRALPSTFARPKEDAETQLFREGVALGPFMGEGRTKAVETPVVGEESSSVAWKSVGETTGFATR